jgi:hypothetical protein
VGDALGASGLWRRRPFEDIKEKLAAHLLTLAGGEAKAYVKVTIEETGPAEWPQLYSIKL